MLNSSCLSILGDCKLNCVKVEERGKITSRTYGKRRQGHLRPLCSSTFLRPLWPGSRKPTSGKGRPPVRPTAKTARPVRRSGAFLGKLKLETGRDRSGSFEQMVVPKRQFNITAEPGEKTINFYGLGLSTRDITKYAEEMYQMDIQAATPSSIIYRISRRPASPAGTPPSPWGHLPARGCRRARNRIFGCPAV